MNDGCYGSKRDLVAASSDTRRFYELLDALAAKHGGPRNLAVASGRMAWPHRGVYFFFEPGEARVGSGAGQRVVRVGTHALKAGAQSSLWGARLNIADHSQAEIIASRYSAC
jgi:hypothetical protein